MNLKKFVCNFIFRRHNFKKGKNQHGGYLVCKRCGYKIFYKKEV